MSEKRASSQSCQSNEAIEQIKNAIFSHFSFKKSETGLKGKIDVENSPWNPGVRIYYCYPDETYRETIFDLSARQIIGGDAPIEEKQKAQTWVWNNEYALRALSENKITKQIFKDIEIYGDERVTDNKRKFQKNLLGVICAGD